MKTILICGAYLNYNNNNENKLYYIDNAANNLSKKLIKGFKECLGNDLIIINCPFIGSFPQYTKKIYYKGKKSAYKSHFDIGFFNLFAIKNISRYIGIRRILKKIILKYSNQDIRIISYSLHAPFLLALENAKKLNNHIKTCIIIPDLPEMMNLNKKKSKIKTVLKKIDIKIIYKSLYRNDYFVPFTKHIIDYLSLEKNKCAVIDGIAFEDDLDNNTSKRYNFEYKKKAFLYVGTLNYIYGVMNLIEGFKKLEYPDIELWICGKGEAQKEIIKNTHIDNRIKYLGDLTHNELKILYSKCYALINPRPNYGEYVKYSFPSKIIEYLSTGKPVLAYYLDGMSDEYKKYIFEIKYNGADGIYRSLKEFITSSYQKLLQIAELAKKYIKENKTEKIQARRILDLMEGKDEK